ncbi:MAG: heavy-metal-associated domain-containing protein [Bryobacteraceae bacterium]
MKVAIEGMHCDACVRRVRQALEKVDGAKVEKVEVGSAVVAIDPSRQPAIFEAVRKAGFEPRESS